MRALNDALVVLNPRTIGECMAALDELRIPQIRIVEHTEKQIEEEAFPAILADYDFEWLWVVSDDAIVRQPALDAVRKLARKGHPVVTGYSQRSHTEWKVNLTDGPLLAGAPSPLAYSFYEFRDVVSYPDPVVPTGFAGMSLTGMSKEMWEEFPFACYGTEPRDTGYASDFHLSRRLQKAEIPIVAAREGFSYHWRTDWVATDGIQDQRPRFDNPAIVFRPAGE